MKSSADKNLMPVIVFIGASYNWVPTLLRDLLSVMDEIIEVRFIDIDHEAAIRCLQWGKAANRVYGRNDRYFAFTDRKAGLKGADAVLITISTGGFDAMEKDLRIPEKFGIMSTVGDTCGPAGWSRAIRNIPVFRQFAEDFTEICPDALIVNYSNPMAALTATLQLCCPNPVIGLCHAYFETKDVIQKIFGLPDWTGIELEIAGMNHFTWVTDLKINGQDGYMLLKNKVGKGSLEKVLPEVSADELGFISGHRLCASLYDAYGYLTYPADRHTCEFVSYVVTCFPEIIYSKHRGMEFQTISSYGINRTSIPHRKAYREKSIDLFDSIFTMDKQEKPQRSRETGADMIRAYLRGFEITDAVNSLNKGRIASLPDIVCIETLGCVGPFGVRPAKISHLPDTVAELIRPAAISQAWLVQGMLSENKDMVIAALHNDEQCKNLRPDEVSRMSSDLLSSFGKEMLPGFLFE